MGADRSALARIDRKLLASFGDDEALRTVRVPATAAKWSTWKRYCDSAGISMGRAVTTLIDRELMGVFETHAGDETPVFEKRATEELAIREANVAARERETDVAEERLDEWNDRLRAREGEIRARERGLELALKRASQPPFARVKVGRNERCPCGSGLKYKRCHGP